MENVLDSIWLLLAIFFFILPLIEAMTKRKESYYLGVDFSLIVILAISWSLAIGIIIGHFI
jgi:hypothetical protein